MKSKIITANKDKGTSVGFSEKWNDDVKDIGEKLNLNTVCEHEWETFEKRNNSNMVEAIGDFCILCGIPKPKIDFKIKDNLEVINKQEWEDIWNEFTKSFEFKKITNSTSSITHIIFLQWLKENYFAPEKK